MGGIERQLDIGGLRAGDLADDATGDRGDVVEIAAAHRLAPLAADEVSIFLLERAFDDFLVQHLFFLQYRHPLSVVRNLHPKTKSR